MVRFKRAILKARDTVSGVFSDKKQPTQSVSNATPKIRHADTDKVVEGKQSRYDKNVEIYKDGTTLKKSKNGLYSLGKLSDETKV